MSQTCEMLEFGISLELGRWVFGAFRRYRLSRKKRLVPPLEFVATLS